MPAKIKLETILKRRACMGHHKARHKKGALKGSLLVSIADFQRDVCWVDIIEILRLSIGFSHYFLFQMELVQVLKLRGM